MIKVNQIEISEDAIAAEMQYHGAETQREAMLKAGESLVISELLRQRANELGFYDKESAKDEDSFSQQLFNHELDCPSASDQDCLNYFKQNPDKFFSSPLVEARHILVAANPADPEASMVGKEKAEKLLRQLQVDGQLFDMLAKQYSDCTSKETGGQLGQLSRGQTVPEFERQVFQCVQGLIAAPIETRYGFHIVKIDHVVPGKALPLEAVEERIRHYLNEKVRRKAIAQYIEQLISSAEIEGFDFNVSDSPLMN